MWLLIPKLTQSDLTKAWSEVYIYMYEVKYKISDKYVKVCKVPQQCISNILRLKSGVTQKNLSKLTTLRRNRKVMHK